MKIRFSYVSGTDIHAYIDKEMAREISEKIIKPYLKNIINNEQFSQEIARESKRLCEAILDMNNCIDEVEINEAEAREEVEA